MAAAEALAQEREERKLNPNEHTCQPCKAVDRAIKTLIWSNAITAFLSLTMTISAITYGTLIYRVQSQANDIAHTQLQLSNQIAFVSLCLADNNETIDKPLCDSFINIFNSRLQNITAGSHATAALPIMVQPPLAEQIIPLPPVAEPNILARPTEQIPLPAPSVSSPRNNPDPTPGPATQPASRNEKIVNNIILVLGISAMLTVYFLLLYRLGKVDD